MRKLTFVLICAALFLFACDKNNAADESATAETTQNADGETTEASEDGAAATDEGAEDGQADGQEEGATADVDEDAPYTQLEDKPTPPELLKPPAEPLEAPDTYRVKFETTAGDFTVKVDKNLAPTGANRLYTLVKLGYFDNVAFFRVINGFMAQFGLHGDPAVNKAWREQPIKDDEVKGSNKRGMVTFATAGKDTRTTQLFINFGDNNRLDGMGFAPFGEVEGDGMKVVDELYDGYGEGAPSGRGPSQGLIQAQGNSYLQENFPKLDYIKTATIVEDEK